MSENPKTSAVHWHSTNVGWRYGIAVAAFVISTSIRLMMDALLASDRGFILFLPAILLVTFFAGLGPAILTSVLSGIALWYVFLPPFYSFALSPDGVVGLITFAFGSAVGITLVHWLRTLITRTEADLDNMTRLNELGNQLVREGKDIDKCLGKILDVAIVIAGANKGNVQLFDLDSDCLILTAHRGFRDCFLKYFENVHDAKTACAEAMRSRQQVIVEDVKLSEIFAGQPTLSMLLAEDVRAVISTPLTSSTGILLGMISMHFSQPHRPSEQQTRLMNLLVRQAADYLERKRAEQIEEVLVREVQHRSNNLLAVVQSIANKSLSGQYPLTEAKKAFEARLHALARVNGQLTKLNWSGVDLREIARFELEPFGERAILDGINLIVSAQYAQNFSLALHELATNAAKYGALSNENGMVKVSWTIIAEARNNRLNFKWREKGGPPVAAPTRSGFGTSLLKAMFSNVRFDYSAQGLTCEIEVLLHDNKVRSVRAANLEISSTPIPS